MDVFALCGFGEDADFPACQRLERSFDFFVFFSQLDSPRRGGYKTQIRCSSDEGVREIIPGIEKEEHDSLKQTDT